MRRLLVAGPVLVFLALQLSGPEAPGPRFPDAGPVSDHVPLPEEVERLLRRACYDCHSGETRWPWYSRVAPASWLVVDHVRVGRVSLDFSHWWREPDVEPTPEQRLRWTCREIREGHMPPLSYRLAHPGAWLDEGEAASICSWTERALASLSRATPAAPSPPPARSP